MAKQNKENAMLVEHRVKNPYGFRVPDLRQVRGELRYDPPEQVVTRSIRDDPLARLHHRGQINEAAYEAGRLIQRYFEAAEVGRVRSSGDLKEAVDGGSRIPEMLTDHQQRAIKQLNRIAPILGQEGFAIVRWMLAERKFAKEIARIMGYRGTQRDTDYISRRIQECLMSAAHELQLA